jgi:hypothetical protein
MVNDQLTRGNRPQLYEDALGCANGKPNCLSDLPMVIAKLARDHIILMRDSQKMLATYYYLLWSSTQDGKSAQRRCPARIGSVFATLEKQKMRVHIRLAERNRGGASGPRL